MRIPLPEVFSSSCCIHLHIFSPLLLPPLLFLSLSPEKKMEEDKKSAIITEPVIPKWEKEGIKGWMDSTPITNTLSVPSLPFFSSLSLSPSVEVSFLLSH